MQETLTPDRRKFRTLAWSVLIFNVVVVLGGAIVRATGSGDGCGESWPLCTDRIFPANPGVETVIEFSHRVTSALAVLGVILMFVFAVRLYEKGHRVRNAAAASLALLLFESVLGALLIVFGWVDQDASIGRMIVVPIHLLNTYILVGALTLTAWWASGNPGPTKPVDTRMRRSLILGAVGLLLIGAIGALNALGDSLYPAENFFSGVAEEFSSDAPWLLQLRIFHPIIAIVVGFGVAYLIMRLIATATDRTKRLGTVTGGLIFVQFLVGILNVLLAAPLETQVIHLAIADAIWIIYLMFGASLLGERAPAKQRTERVA
ncbi:MAG: COX15/CtaA family protein [Actinomycetota bacterium]|nr:COX15/CtaA family protein [Actinomycetota bacterium]